MNFLRAIFGFNDDIIGINKLEITKRAWINTLIEAIANSIHEEVSCIASIAVSSIGTYEAIGEAVFTGHRGVISIGALKGASGATE